MNLPAVEIDLSGLPRNASKWDIREQIIRKAPRQWLHNPKLEIKRREREIYILRACRSPGLGVCCDMFKIAQYETEVSRIR